MVGMSRKYARFLRHFTNPCICSVWFEIWYLAFSLTACCDWLTDDYRRISVYIFCLSNIWSSLSDEANKVKPLNIERAWQFQLSLKIWVRYTEWLRRNSHTKNVWLINFFASQQFRTYLWLIFLSMFKELKVVQIAQVNRLFQLLNLLRIYGRHEFYELSRMLMRKM